jgi:RNAse (barnase) inhibitor barstar
MALFIDDPDFLNDRLDWIILQNGWSSLYCRQDVLESDLLWFRTAGFKIIEISCSDWDKSDVIHQSLKKALSFPDYYGNNLHALNDCLSDVEIPGEGLIVVFKFFDTVQQQVGQKIVDIFANNSRRHILFGRKLILLIQVSSRGFNLADVGGSPVLWNGTEFFVGRQI